jgi:hypothetical protein
MIAEKCSRFERVLRSDDRASGERKFFIEVEVVSLRLSVPSESSMLVRLSFRCVTVSRSFGKLEFWNRVHSESADVSTKSGGALPWTVSLFNLQTPRR